jgi:hypothetical protein
MKTISQNVKITHYVGFGFAAVHSTRTGELLNKSRGQNFGECISAAVKFCSDNNLTITDITRES